MPTTLIGLLIFISIIAPGLSFVFIIESRLPKRRVSAFRETVSIAAIGLLCDAVVLLAYVILKKIWPNLGFDFGLLIRDPSTYWSFHYEAILWTSVIALTTACILGATLGWFWDASAFSEYSGWWSMFREAYEEVTGVESILVFCELTNAEFVVGALRSFNTDSVDSLDREIVLQAPLYHAPTPNSPDERATEANLIENVGLTAINAHQIKQIWVSFLPYNVADVSNCAPEPMILLPSGQSSQGNQRP